MANLSSVGTAADIDVPVVSIDTANGVDDADIIGSHEVSIVIQ